MVYYLVVVGDLEEEHHAAQAALHHVYPGRDKVLLITVTDIVDADPNAIDVSFVDSRQRKIEEESKQKMRITGNQFVSIGVECSLVVVPHVNPGQAILKAAQDHHVDAIIVGNKELGVFQKILNTTTAKYLVDHAECNVIVIKNVYPHALSAAAPASASASTAAAAAAPRFTTLRSADEMTARLSHVQAQQAASNSPKIGQAQRTAAPPASGQSKLEVALQEELHRIQVEHTALLDRIQQLEEEEIARTVKEREKQVAAELANKRAEGQEELDRVRQLEEEERQRRLQEEVGPDQELKERLQNVKLANRMEDEEKARRITLWKEQVASLEQRHQALEYTRSLEERERQDRIKDQKDQITAEDAQLKQELKQHLTVLAEEEEKERERRVKIKQEEDQREKQLQRTQSKEDLALTKRLEEEERQRRVANDQGDRAEESKKDLDVARALEEEERQRRIKEEKH